MSLYTKKVISIVEKLVTPIVESEGLELVDIEFQREGRGWVLRVYIDKAGGVTLNDCTIVSQQLSALLDIEDPIDTAYTLEVSSPGLTRPLKKEEDYKKYEGHLVQIKTYQSINGQKIFRGTLLGIEEGIVKVEIKGKIYEIPLDSIAKANLDFEI
ncbi:MAG TPA: ribosome maturation factor RimP [Candidatus Desulfofervidus auxilii]|uniref:Ribosome maturation factor RimP n=1 Tax=Desulfofervidus auxilii TaxID=1621989 RepID=A0A7C0U301_DESA2|nr:ribosome maturation factor RimP [Candidatus Desulfofervidus auxilii]